MIRLLTLECETVPNTLPHTSPSIFYIRPHYFVEKKVVTREVCSVCNARIGFRKIHYKCRDCAVSSHIECR